MKKTKILFGLLVFVDILSAGCYKSSIMSPAPFMGNNGEIFKLFDGSFWEVKYEYEYLYEYYPDVIMCPENEKLIIAGKTLNVKSLSGNSDANASSSDIIESQIDGDFNGWNGETIFKLTNGQIWQQSSYAYTYSYSFMPKVIIYKVGKLYKMQVKGVTSSIYVKRLY
jgi:hypothetical protein